MEALVNPVREYAWGSRTVIAALQGRPTPSPHPEAELWIGAHPSAPSLVRRPEGERPLTEVIAAEPERTLGPRVRSRYGARLPFLLKILAAEEPLSLQAHPDTTRAQARYAADDPSYVDPYHKPEMLVAITEFRGLCGFRDPAVSAQVFDRLEVPALSPVVAALRRTDLAGAVGQLLRWPPAQRPALLASTARALARMLERGGRLAGPHRAEYTTAADLARRYPGDVGVLVALLLHHVRLAPGEALWMPAGNLHAYLHGTGLELMAASDNVLRGGLTPKPVDVPELLEVLSFTPLDDPRVPEVPVRPGLRTWPVPVADFALYEAVLGEIQPRLDLHVEGPRLVFCLDGTVTAQAGGEPLVLRAGESGFAPAASPKVSLTGSGTAYVATVGERPLRR